jgi:hypothetical protein
MAAWGATKQSKALTLPGISPKASVVTFASENMRESAAIQKNVRENCRVLIVRVLRRVGSEDLISRSLKTIYSRIKGSDDVLCVHPDTKTAGLS